jgi:signal transduction histidine kinase
MQLQRKLLGLFLMLGAVALINVLVTSWALRHIHREVALPLAEIQQTLGTLHTIKRATEAIGTSIGRDGPIIPSRFHPSPSQPLPPETAPDTSPDSTASTPTDPGLREAINAHFATARAALVRLRDIGTPAGDQATGAQPASTSIGALRIGVNTPDNLSARLDAAAQALDRAFQTPPPPSPTPGPSPHLEHLRTAGQSLLEIHELIERVEGRVLTVAGEETAFHDRLQHSIVWTLATSIGALALAVVLSLALVHRWITRPISHLRDAAAAFAQARFDHRAPALSTDELGRLGREFNHMASTIVQMHEERLARERLAAMGEMVRRLVHNIRTPIAGVRSLAELTKDDLRDAPPPVPPFAHLHEHMDRIIRTVDGFEHWLKGLLETTRPLDLAPEPTDVHDWLQRTLDPLHALATASSVTLELRTDQALTTATFDPRHLRQALVGLINNAIQASPPDSTVTIEACLDPAPTQGPPATVPLSWLMTITDQGPGILPENHQRVFLPHFTTKIGGTGIGLAVAKQTIEQHGGTISIEAAHPLLGYSGPIGTRFVVRLPIKARSWVASTSQPPGSEGPALGQTTHHRG